MRKHYLKLILIAFLGLFITNCSGEDGINGTDGVDGIDGVDGVDGADGIDGVDGVDGADGANGEGFDELTKNGSIILTLDGTRPDGQAFTDTTEFKFLSVGSNYLSSSNLAEIGESINEFNIFRFLSAPDDIYQHSHVYIQLDVNNPGEETESFFFELNISDFAVISDDNKYFEMNFDSQDSSVTNLEITNYSYDEDTHNLIFSFSLNVAGSENVTDHELSISGEVNVILFEKIPTSIDGE